MAHWHLGPVERALEPGERHGAQAHGQDQGIVRLPRRGQCGGWAAAGCARAAPLRCAASNVLSPTGWDEAQFAVTPSTGSRITETERPARAEPTDLTGIESSRVWP
jgi:hypothetical protein